MLGMMQVHSRARGDPESRRLPADGPKRLAPLPSFPYPYILCLDFASHRRREPWPIAL